MSLVPRNPNPFQQEFTLQFDFGDSAGRGWGFWVLGTWLSPPLFQMVGSENPPYEIYWSYLDKALEESDEAIHFGYFGCDMHLNQKIKSFTN